MSILRQLYHDDFGSLFSVEITQLTMLMFMGGASGEEQVRDAVNSELKDVANAIRKLDQSYYYRGFRSCKAWTAGSYFIDPMHRRKKADIVCGTVHQWPVNTKELLFIWRNGIKAPWEFRGQAAINKQGELCLANGAAVPTGIKENLQLSCMASNQLTIETVIIPAHANETGPARIVSFSTDASSRNFTLGQNGDKLIFRLRTEKTDLNGTKPELELLTLEPGKRHHIVVTYQPGTLCCYLNGKLAVKTDALQGRLSNWTEQNLILGDEWNGQRDWSGCLKQVALYSRTVDAQEVAKLYEATRVTWTR